MFKPKFALYRKLRFFFVCLNIVAVFALFLCIFENHINDHEGLTNAGSLPLKVNKTEYTKLLKTLNISDGFYSSFDIIDSYMAINSYNTFESPNLMPKRRVNYDRKNVVATKFGDQKYLQTLNNKKLISNDKNLYFLLKYYLWCLVNNINYPIVPININEWQPADSTETTLFAFKNPKKCKCDSNNSNIDLDYREEKESMYCKKKQSKKFLQEVVGFNPDLATFLFKKDIDLSFLSIRIKTSNQEVTKNLALFLKEMNHFNDVDSKPPSSIYYPINEIVNEINAFNSFNSPYPILGANKIPKEVNYQLKKQDFRWDLESKFNEYKTTTTQNSITEISKLKQGKLDFTAQRYRNIKINLKELISKKYFYEVALKSSIENVWRSGTHYDWRFFKGLKPLSERNEILNDLFDAWSTFTKKDSIISWLSHGNLLSWIWSGGQFLWDKDLDIQLPISHFSFMAENYNNTLFMYMTHKNEFKMYYLDINPCYADIYHGKEGKNSIDGRFIDVQSGLYIDLTAISYKQIELETAPTDKYALDKLQHLKWSKNLNQKMKPADSNKNKKESESKTVLLGDKNYHFYESIDTFNPLRKVKYGYLESDTYVPFDITSVLNDEYPNGLVVSEYDDYNYDWEYHGWVKKCESRSKKTEHRNCEGLSNSQFDLTKEAWLNHFSRELKFCSHEVVSKTSYCQWFLALSKGIDNEEKGFLKSFRSAHKYSPGKSKSELFEANLKTVNTAVGLLPFNKTKLLELGYPPP
ncbi:hypothetical protein FOG51_00020 [Hanseniaspora uvarum]|nr:hypothetical protein FOG51_00020 [Hanseniaspora uvarum]